MMAFEYGWCKIIQSDGSFASFGLKIGRLVVKISNRTRYTDGTLVFYIYRLAGVSGIARGKKLSNNGKK